MIRLLPYPGLNDIAGHWAQAYITELYNRGIVNGKRPGIYDPNGNLTRAELTKMATLAFGMTVPSSASAPSFGDVEVTAWYAPFIQVAKAVGIVEGFPGNLFKPNNEITRAEALKIILETAGATVADMPTLYHVNVIPSTPFLVIPEVSSERREYVPIGWLEPPTIPSNLVRIIGHANKPLFALLTSAMHMSWLRHIGGRLKSDYRYSIGLVYNTFPLPPVGQDKLNELEPLAQAVLDARSRYETAALADLYDPHLMPSDLRRAHQALDRAVDRLYRRNGFISERERVEHLFGLYEKMVNPLFGKLKKAA